MTVLTTEQEFFGTEELGFEEEMNNNYEVPATEEVTTVLAVAPVAQGNNEFWKGVGVGLLAGALAGAVAWFYERHNRAKLLEQLEITTFIAAGMAENKDVTKYGKKEIDLAKELQISNPDKLIMTVHNNIEKVRMSKKEKKRWKEAMSNLIELTLVWNNKALAASKAKEVKPEEVTETLVEQ